MSEHKKFTVSARLIESKFNSGLEKSKPYLFNLAQQVIAAEPERNWGLLLGDDTSGRPVTHFIRQVLMRRGVRPSTAFFCASQQSRQHVSNGQYVNYLQHISARNNDPQRVLLVSENIGTGKTAEYISSLLHEVFPEVDLATVGSYYDAPQVGAENTYIGGTGEDAWRTVFDTFEDTIVTSEARARRNKVIARIIPEVAKPMLLRVFPQPRTSTSYPITNLVSSMEYPYAEISPDPTYRGLAQKCHDRMAELALEFVETQF